MRDFEDKNVTFVEKLDHLTFLLEDDPGQKETVESLRYSLVGEYSPYKGKFRKMRVENQHLLACLFTSEPDPAPPPPTVVAQTVRKDYSYLKPAITVGNCTKRELKKFGQDCKI